MNSIIKSFVASFVLITFLSLGLVAAEKLMTVNIQTSAICESCKSRIEKTLKEIEGVDAVLLNLNSKKVKVKYDPAKTSPQALRTVISNIGYNADEVKANADAYHKLPGCCQKPGVCEH